ncbi:hypothetical protein [Aquiflexum gelatinilyticum]|uniref:Seryl-tRNA synthetase n=1 Tax=Aquiflexum gelatinilyticum TaxID=2961943 RepID=A0A9X2T3Z5_9BACT|nr:hypothetical protein [Aquiflexum gelatinilyticum]MCR9016985.1 hypothetical protein [Aquiflexum gelatinilyticum]MCS4433836.1 hypothetical protein [Aquiflexum gelatinilyticum]
MKKLMYVLSFFVMVFAFEVEASAASNKKVKEELSPEQKERLSEIEVRVEEIKAMDFSEMSKEERKEVKNELKDMKVEAKQMGGGVYLSVGAIIIILLLLILLT